MIPTTPFLEFMIQKTLLIPLKISERLKVHISDKYFRYNNSSNEVTGKNTHTKPLTQTKTYIHRHTGRKNKHTQTYKSINKPPNHCTWQELYRLLFLITLRISKKKVIVKHFDTITQP